MPTEMPLVLVCDGVAEAGLDVLRGHGLRAQPSPPLDPARLPEALREAAALIVRSATRVTPAILEAAPGLRVVGRAGVGVDNIDVEAASRRGIVVMNTPRGNATSAAELTMGLMLALARHLPQAAASTRAGRWEKQRFTGTELSGKTLGVLGLGHIGRLVAERALAFRMRVVAYDPYVSMAEAGRLGVEMLALDGVLSSADILSVHVPLTADTRGLLGQAALARARRGVLLVHAARGGIVDQAALLDALRSGQVGGAALDVFEREPPGPNPLLMLDNVIATPHLGASTEEAQDAVSIEIAEQIAAYLMRGEVRAAVNLPPLPPETLRRLRPWLDLGDRLGSLCGQLAPEGLAEIEVEAAGEPGDPEAGPVCTAALTGLLGTFLDAPVNRVNARLVAADRGLRVTEIRSPAGRDYASALGVRLRGAGERLCRGTLFFAGTGAGPEAEPRVVQLDSFHLEFEPQGPLLYVKNRDRPGVIGAIGTLLGRHGVNVARVAVGQDRARGEAVALWSLDTLADGATLEELRGLANVLQAVQVRL
jgi:D-3-phosphoglycerate dehydrogenase / 2-oxoglutarate reductase